METTTLQIESKIKLFNFILTNITSNYMENTNGIFFPLNDITDKEIKNVLNYIEGLKKNEEIDNSSEHAFFENMETHEPMNNKDNYIDVANDDGDQLVPKTASFSYDKNVVKEFENNINKVNKKSIHVKYSIAKKRYNKQHQQQDSKKIDNTDLKELVEESYML